MCKYGGHLTLLFILMALHTMTINNNYAILASTPTYNNVMLIPTYSVSGVNIDKHDLLNRSKKLKKKQTLLVIYNYSKSSHYLKPRLLLIL